MINRPKLYFRVIWPKIISRRIIPLSFHSSLFLFIIFLWFLISLSSFSFLCFCSYSLLFLYGVSSTSFETLFSSYLPSSIRHLIAYSPLEKSFFAFVFAPSVGGDPWSGYWKKNYQAQKGWLWIIFFSERMMKDGHFSS